MGDQVEFQIVCTRCGCLSIKIRDPIKFSREAVVYCGDCGAERGTLGALRALAVQGDPIPPYPLLSSAFSAERRAPDEVLVPEVSKQYAELQRLRLQVKIAELFASGFNRRLAAERTLKRMRRLSSFIPSSSKRTAHLGYGRDQK